MAITIIICGTLIIMTVLNILDDRDARRQDRERWGRQ